MLLYDFKTACISRAQPRDQLQVLHEQSVKATSCPFLQQALDLESLTLVYHKWLKKIKHTVTFGNLLVFTEMHSALLANP